MLLYHHILLTDSFFYPSPFQVMSFSTFALDKVYQEANYSTTNCPDGSGAQEYIEGICSGVSLAKADVCLLVRLFYFIVCLQI